MENYEVIIFLSIPHSLNIYKLLKKRVGLVPNEDQGSSDPIRILHIDDEQDLLIIAARMLMSIDPNLQIESTTSPSEALEKIKNNEYDCIISDYKMPAIDGIQLAERIRKESNIPVILYTGQGSEEVAERAFGVGIDDYIRKEMEPAHYQVLVRRIRAAVEGYQAETRLHDRELELSGMIENSIDGIFRVEMSRGITRCNPAFLNFFGFSLDELQSMGLGMLDLIHYEDKAQFMSELDGLSSRGLRNYSSLNRWRTKSGEVIWLDSNVTALIQGKKFIGVEIIARDVTERKKYVNRLESIYQHASSLSHSQTLKEVAKFTLDGIEGIFGFEQTSFTEIQGNVIKAVEIRSDSPPVRNVIPLDGEGIIAKVARTGKTIHLSDVRDDPDYFEAKASTRSELTVPVNVEGETVAVINIESSKVNAFSSEDQRLMEIFSEHVASAMLGLTQFERVQSSEERYRVLLESSIDAITVITDDVRVFWNKRAEELFGYPGDELGCVDRFGFIHPEDRGIIRDRIEKRRLGEEIPENYLLRIMRKDGSTRFVEIYTLDIVFMGKPSLMSVIRDLTQRKQLEDVLQRSYEESKTVLEGSADPIVVSDSEKFIYLNQKAVELFGYTDSLELVGQPFLGFFTPEYQDIIRIRARERLKGETLPSRYEVQIQRADGSFVPVEFHLSVIEFNAKPAILNVIRDITERKKMEEEVREIGKQYRTLFDSLIDDILVIDPQDYTIIKANNTALNNLKMIETDIVGKKCYEITHHLSAPCEPLNHLCPIEQIQETGEPIAVEHTHYNADGNPIYVEISLNPIRDEEGNIVQIIHISRDISERRRLMEETKKSEERLELIFEYAPDAIYLNDMKGNFIDGNRAAEKLTGYTREELIGKNFMKLNLLSRRQLPKAAKLLAQNIMGQPTGPDDFTMTRKNGKQVSVEISTYPVKLKDGPVVMGIARDISNRMEYERKLEALHLHASQLASAQTLEEVSNITLDTMTDALGYNLHSFQTVENDILIIRGIRGAPSWNVPLPIKGRGITARAAREARSILLNDVRKDPDFIKGSTESLSELTVPVIREGRAVAVLNVESVRLDAFTLRDQQLLELLANHVSSALTRILSQRDLEEIRERHSVELVRGIQRVSSMVRHDLRGPLQTIMNANYLMEKDPDSFDEMRTLIKSSVKHANEIMEDWKNQGIDEQLTLSDTDIHALIEEVLNISLIPSDVKVSNIVEPMVLHLDRIKTRRVLDNLIRNAVEAMPKGGALSIEGKVDGDVYLLEVKDTGIGISGDGLSKLFTPFYTTKPNGMGLGLAFCKRTIEAYGGTIEVNTIEGKGTTFTLNIPTCLSLTHSHTEQLDEITVDKQA